MNLLSLSVAYLRRRPLDTLLCVTLLSLGTATIVALLLVGSQLEESMTRDSEGVDVVVGAKGSPVQLILSAVLHLDAPTGNIPLQEAERLAGHPMIELAVPVALGDSFRGFPVVGTNDGFVELRQVEMRGGRWWHAPFEVVLGDRVARESGLQVGDELVTTHGLEPGGEAHGDRTMRVVGIASRSGGVVDRIVLTSVETIWEVHAAPEQGGPHEEHDHELTAMLMRYRSPAGTILFPRFVDAESRLQAASPAMETVRLFSLLGVGLDAIRAFGVLLVGAAALSIFVSLYNTIQARRQHLAMLRTLGASRGTLLRHVLLEAALLGLLGVGSGLALGHAAAEVLGNWSRAARQIALTGWTWLPAEATLAIGLLVVGLLAALLPAIQAYRVDIARTLAR